MNPLSCISADVIDCGGGLQTPYEFCGDVSLVTKSQKQWYSVCLPNSCSIFPPLMETYQF